MWTNRSPMWMNCLMWTESDILNVSIRYAICSRGDLRSGGNASAGGCYDTKVTSYKYGAMQIKAEAINGPSQVPTPN